MAFHIASQAFPFFTTRTYVDVVRHPEEVENEFSVHGADQAKEILKQEGLKDVEALKSLVRGMDMTNISTRELAMIGQKLHQMMLTEEFSVNIFFAGNRDTDENGLQRNIDVKFNAIALFNQKYQGHLELSDQRPHYRESDSFQEVGRGIKSANHLLALLSWFAHSSNNDLAINEIA